MFYSVRIIFYAFYCSLAEGFEPKICASNMPNERDLHWFDSKPNNLLKVHEELYGDVIDKFFKGDNT